MNNQRGGALVPIAVSTALLVTLVTVSADCLEEHAEEIIAKANEAQVTSGHCEIKERIELNHQAYYIDKLAGQYKGDLLDYLEEKGFTDDQGVVNTSTLLGRRDDDVSTGKGTEGKDVYKVEIDSSSQNAPNDKDYKIMYYDEKGEALQVGKI